MNRIIHIAYDNTDKTLGHYFERCATEVKKVADLIGLNCVLIDSNGLDVKTINAHTANADKYIFVAFSHGSPDALWGQKEHYIKAANNLKNFYNSILYTFACKSAIYFSPELDSASIPCYCGYLDKAWASVHPQLENYFVQCAIKGIISFLHGKSTADSMRDLIEEYNCQIKETKKIYGEINPISAALLKNKQALRIIVYNKAMTIFD
jgi:hypothetical protein